MNLLNLKDYVSTPALTCIRVLTYLCLTLKPIVKSIFPTSLINRYRIILAFYNSKNISNTYKIDKMHKNVLP